MNKVYLIGNLTRDPESAATSTGKTVCRFSIATDRRQKDADGKPITDFHSIVAFGKLGDSCFQYLKKGNKAAVIGELQYSKYEKDGEKRTSTAIVASDVEFLTPKTVQKSLEGFEDYDGDLPF